MPASVAAPRPAPATVEALEVPSRWPLLLAGAIFLISFLFYLTCLAPTITWRFSAFDSGELAAAAYTWGVAHPTGYPLWTVLGFIFTRLPFGDVAGRTSLLSAFCGAGAAALVALATLRLSASLPVRPQPRLRLIAAAAAGLAVATSPAFWSQSILTETYSLNALFVALILWLLTDTSTTPRPRGRLAFVCGLALTNHSTAVFAVAAALLVVFLRQRRAFLRPAPLLCGAILFVVPLSLYLLLPWRAAQHPAENWNNPVTWQRFYALVSGAQYHYLVDWQHPLDAVRAAPAIVRLFLGQFAWWGLPLALYGLLLLWERERPLALASLLIIFVYAIFMALYLADGRERYLLPGYEVEAVLIGCGLAALGSDLAQWAAARRLRPSWPAVALAALAALSIIPFAWYHFGSHDLRHDYQAYDYARDALKGSPPHGTIVSSTDQHTFALWYFQKVEGYRRDVRVVDTRLANP